MIIDKYIQKQKVGEIDRTRTIVRQQKQKITWKRYFEGTWWKIICVRENIHDGFYQEKQKRKGRKLLSNVILQRKIKVSIVINYSSSKYNDTLNKFKKNIKAIKWKIFFF